MLQFAAMPAERRRGAVLVDDFYSGDTVARNGWTLTGAPSFASGGGLILNGSTQYATRPLSGELNSAEITIHLEFYPDNAHTEDRSYYFFDNEAGDRYRLYKLDETTYSSGLVLRLGGTEIATVPAATYGPYWVTGGRNLITISGTSGNTNVDFNGHRVLTADSSAWTPSNPSTLYLGDNLAGTGKFDGRISRLYIGQHTSTLAEHTAYYNNTMFSWRNRATVDLQFRTADYDIGNVRTLDSSGNGNHFTLGDGSTPTTYPTQGTGCMAFDGGDYLNGATNPTETGAWSLMVAGVSTSKVNQAEYFFDVQTGRLIFGWFAGEPNLQFYTGTSYPVSGNWTKGDGLFHTAVLSNDGSGNYVLYVDGKRGSYASTSDKNISGAVVIGARYSMDSSYFNGSLDHAGILNFAMNQTQAIDYHETMKKRIGREV